jgi:hypothetical protein
MIYAKQFGYCCAARKSGNLRAEQGGSKLDLNPLDGTTLERNIRELFALDPALLPRLAEILK